MTKKFDKKIRSGWWVKANSTRCPLTTSPQHRKDDGEPLKRLFTAETQGGFFRVEAPCSDLKELTLTELAEEYPTNASEVTT